MLPGPRKDRCCKYSFVRFPSGLLNLEWSLHVLVNKAIVPLFENPRDVAVFQEKRPFGSLFFVKIVFQGRQKRKLTTFIIHHFSGNKKYGFNVFKSNLPYLSCYCPNIGKMVRYSTLLVLLLTHLFRWIGSSPLIIMTRSFFYRFLISKTKLPLS